METIFTQKRSEYVVTYYLVELLDRSIEQAGEGADVEQVLPPVLKKLGYKPPYTETAVMQLLQDLKAMEKAKVEQASRSPKKAKSPKRSYGHDFFKWMEEVKVDGALLMALQYDYEKAEKAYKTLPYQVVDKIIDLKFKQVWHQMQSQFESVVLGMGGSMGSSSEVIDHAAGEENVSLDDMAKGLKALGF